jgi:hypothetical protein
MDILSFVRSKGPVLPVDVAKFLDTNTLFASAHLSELLSKGQLKISSVKVGGSPVYYLPGQEARLQEYSSRLHEKEQRAYHLLKEKLVLKDSDQAPVVRFALRQIKDYAKPVEVMLKGEKHLFWRWYLTPMHEVEALIKKEYATSPAPPPPSAKPDAEPSFQSKLQKESNQSSHTPLAPNFQPAAAQPPQRTPLEGSKQDAPHPGRESDRQGMPRAEPSTQPSHPPVQKPEPGRGFLSQVDRLFEEGRIRVASKEILKKDKHASYIILVPSSLGPLEFYAEAKSKKRLSESDLSETFVRGSSKHLPVVFITDGKLSKRTEEQLSASFKGMAVKTI